MRRVVLALLDRAKPVTPSDVTAMDVDGFVVSMVADAFEKDPTGKKGDLKSLDIKVDTQRVPGVEANGIRQEGGEEAVKVKEEEEAPAKGMSSRRWREGADL